MLKTALALAARGFRVFPLHPGEKAPPLIKGFPTHATTDLAQVRRWWEAWPTANVGIHGAGMVIVDEDVRNGGPEAFALLDMLEGFPPTLTTLTPSGGRHLFYRLPDGHPGVGNSAGKLGPGLDVKSTGGYVVAPGSTVPTGKYRFAEDATIAPAPEWLVQKLGVYTFREHGDKVDISPAGDATVAACREWIKARPQGDQAFTTACMLRDRGLSEAQALALLMEHDGRPAGTLAPKVAHAYEYAQNAPGALVASADDFETLPEAAPQPSKPLPRAATLADLAGAPIGNVAYLVKGLLGLRSQAVLYGPPGQGKTFVALDLAFHVAAGLPWRERRVQQAPVLYLAYEGVGGMRARARALVQSHGHADAPMHIVSADFDLRDQAGRKALGALIAELPATPKFIIIDTLARAMMGGDENSAQDIGALNAAVAALIEATGACVMLVHHSGKDKSRGARGSSALLGAIDTEIEVDGRRIKPTKQRDFELAEPLGFELRPVIVGRDQDFDDITSCVVLPAELPKAPSIEGLKGNTLRGWQMLCELTGPTNKPVDEESWRGKCKEFASAKAFFDIKTALKKKRLIAQHPEGWARAFFEAEEAP